MIEKDALKLERNMNLAKLERMKMEQSEVSRMVGSRSLTESTLSASYVYVFAVFRVVSQGANPPFFVHSLFIGIPMVPF